jgi:hypothetical protein
MNTDPISAPRALKPPAVPALSTRSGLNALIARYVVNDAAFVPTLQTPYCSEGPF